MFDVITNHESINCQQLGNHSRGSNSQNKTSTNLRDPFLRTSIAVWQKKHLHSSRCRATSFSATSFRKDSDVVMLQFSKVLVLCIHGHLSIWTFALVFWHVWKLKFQHMFKMRKTQNLTILIIMVFAATKYSCNNWSLDVSGRCSVEAEAWIKKVKITETYRNDHHHLGFITCYSLRQRHAQ